MISYTVGLQSISKFEGRAQWTDPRHVFRLIN
jgi:hypothetical protein